MNFLPIVIPSANTVTGYKVDVTYVREINNP
jgi:hypothetical protein